MKFPVITVAQLNTFSSQYNIICVTGKMAAGKNYICQLLESQGWKSVDADLLVHQAILHKTKEITETFSPFAQAAGINILTEDGNINRRALGQLLFSNPPLLKKQESIVYPEVTRLTKEFIQLHPKSIINATVLYKTPELLNLCQNILFVTAPLPVRFIRARKRDHLPFTQILRRFHSQKNLLKNYSAHQIPITIIKN